MITSFLSVNDAVADGHMAAAVHVYAVILPDERAWPYVDSSDVHPLAAVKENAPGCWVVYVKIFQAHISALADEEQLHWAPLRGNPMCAAVKYVMSLCVVIINRVAISIEATAADKHVLLLKGYDEMPSRSACDSTAFLLLAKVLWTIVSRRKACNDFGILVKIKASIAFKIQGAADIFPCRNIYVASCVNRALKGSCVI